MNYLNENIDSLNKKLQDGEITAEDLAKETVKNIKETDKKINAWITVDEDAKPAEDLDFAKNKLAGIPLLVRLTWMNLQWVHQLNILTMVQLIIHGT